MENTYIVFYDYYTEKGLVGSGWIDKIISTRKKNSCLDVILLTNVVRTRLIKDEKITNDDKIVITNIINQETI